MRSRIRGKWLIGIQGLLVFAGSQDTLESTLNPLRSPRPPRLCEKHPSEFLENLRHAQIKKFGRITNNALASPREPKSNRVGTVDVLG